MTRTCKYGTLHNARAKEGYTLTFLRTDNDVAIYEFDLIYPNALTWENSKGYWRPNKHEEETDLGSTPRFIWPLLPPTQFPIAYVYHDSCWRHNGLWFSQTLNGIYTFYPLTRHEGNQFMHNIISLDDTGFRRFIIYHTVELSQLTYGFKRQTRAGGEDFPSNPS